MAGSACDQVTGCAAAASHECGGGGHLRPSPPTPQQQQPPATGVSPSDGASPPSGTALQAAMAEFVSPFASSFAQAPRLETPPPGTASTPIAPPSQQQQQQQQPASPLPPPERQPSVRVVGFESSPTSVVAMRRWQSAAAPGTAAALEAAAAMDAALAEADPGALDAAGSGRGPRSLLPPKAQQPCSLERKGSLGALLRQQLHLDSVQRRLATINTARPGLRRAPLQSPAQHLHALAQAPPQRGSPAGPPPPPPSYVQATAPSAGTGMAGVAQNLEQDWMAALTPDSSELQAAVAAEQPPRPAAPGPDLEQDWMAALTPDSSELQAAVAAEQPPRPAAPGPAGGASSRTPTRAAAAAAAAVACGPFAAQAQVSFDVAEDGAGTMPTGAGLGLRREASGALGAPLAIRQGSAMLRQGSTSIDIPYHRMKRAETAPALTDDLIAAAAASAASGSSGGLAKASAKAAAAAAARASGSGPTSSAGSSLRGSPPKLATLPERAASATREVFEAHGEAVAALTQAKVLQLALAQEQERAARLEQQLRALLRERAEDKARFSAAQAQWMHVQAQQAQLAQQGMARRAAPAPAMAEPLETWLEETMSALEPPVPVSSPVAAPPVAPAPSPLRPQPQRPPLRVQLQRPPAAAPVAMRAPAALQRPGLASLQRAPAGGLERQQNTTFDELAAALASLGQ